MRESIGLTGQYAAVDEYLTGFENLEMMGRLYHLSKKNSILRAKKLLQQFDLEEAQHRIVKTYSGGMRRRLDLAASLVATPPVLYLDEPTTGLDPRSRLMMWDIIKELVAADVTILLTTQYLEEADQLADRIAVIDTGRIIAEGTSQQLKDRVGKSRLELTLRPGSDGEKAARSMGEGKARYDADERTLHIETDGSVAEIKRILNDVELAGVAIEGLSLHKPTLDDVFMKFTGHKAV